jgi:hypothetical protein
VSQQRTDQEVGYVRRTYELPGVGTAGERTTATPVTVDFCLECHSVLHETTDGTLCCAWRFCGAYGRSIEPEQA